VAALASKHPAAPQIASVTSGVCAPCPPKWETLGSSETPDPCGTIAVNVE